MLFCKKFITLQTLYSYHITNNQSITAKICHVKLGIALYYYKICNKYHLIGERITHFLGLYYRHMWHADRRRGRFYISTPAAYFLPIIGA